MPPLPPLLLTPSGLGSRGNFFSSASAWGLPCRRAIDWRIRSRALDINTPSWMSLQRVSRGTGLWCARCGHRGGPDELICSGKTELVAAFRRRCFDTEKLCRSWAVMRACQAWVEEHAAQCSPEELSLDPLTVAALRGDTEAAASRRSWPGVFACGALCIRPARRPPLFATARDAMAETGTETTPRVQLLRCDLGRPLVYWLMGLGYNLPGQLTDPLEPALGAGQRQRDGPGRCPLRWPARPPPSDIHRLDAAWRLSPLVII